MPTLCVYVYVYVLIFEGVCKRHHAHITIERLPRQLLPRCLQCLLEYGRRRINTCPIFPQSPPIRIGPRTSTGSVAAGWHGLALLQLLPLVSNKHMISLYLSLTGGTAVGASGSAHEYVLRASQGDGGVVGSGGGRRKGREERRVERQEAAARLANTPIGHTKRRELDRQTGQLAISYHSPKADARRELVEGRFAQGLSEVNKTAALAWQLSSPTRAGGSGDAEKGRYAIGSASAGARMSAGSGQL